MVGILRVNGKHIDQHDRPAALLELVVDRDVFVHYAKEHGSPSFVACCSIERHTRRSRVNRGRRAVNTNAFCWDSWSPATAAQAISPNGDGAEIKNFDKNLAPMNSR